MPTTYNAHWAEVANLTVDDSTGKADKTGGSGGSFDASARVEQMFDGGAQLVVEFTIGAIGEMAGGIYSTATSYLKGAVTVNSILACWHIDSGGSAIVKESGTTRATQAGVVNTDVLRITLSAAGALTYHYNGALVHTSAIAASTVLGWRPWRVVTTHSASNSKWDPVQLTGESSEHYDPDVAANKEVQMIPVDALEFIFPVPLYAVHTPETDCDCPGEGEITPNLYRYRRGHLQ